MEGLALHSVPEGITPNDLDQSETFMYEDEQKFINMGRRDSYNRSEAGSPTTYLDISANNMPRVTQMQTEVDQNTLLSWTQKHPEHWTPSEVLDWIYFIADTLQLDATSLRGEAFQNIAGPQLCGMTLDDFIRRDPKNGSCFYDMFRSIRKDAFFLEPPGDFNSSYDNYPCPQEIKSEYDDLEAAKLIDSCLVSEKEMLVCEKEMQVRLGQFWYPIDVTESKETEDILTDCNSGRIWLQEREYRSYGSSDSESMSGGSDVDMPCLGYDTIRRSSSIGSEVISDDDYSNMATIDQKPIMKRKYTTQRRKHSSGDSSQEKQQNRGRKPGQISKGNHLWEFIRDLLKDPKFNPQLLRWEEKDTGVFRFVQSEAVAQMWGRKKNNPGMTYEKLSRAMRFCRSAGYFAEVPKTGKFPKKLCFRFGPKAYGWGDH